MRPPSVLRPQDRVGRGIDLQPSFGEIVGRLHDVLVGHLLRRDLGVVHEVVERKLGDAGHRGGVELAGFGARALHELGDGLDLHRGRHADAEDGRGVARDRHDVGRIVGQLLVLERMDDEVAARSPQEGVVVVGGEHGLDRDDAVAAGPVIDHDRLAPFLLEPFLDQPRADVGAGAGAEGNDEADRPLRPLSLRLRRQRRAGPGFRARRRRRQISTTTNACVPSGCFCPKAREQG